MTPPFSSTSYAFYSAVNAVFLALFTADFAFSLTLSANFDAVLAALGALSAAFSAIFFATFFPVSILQARSSLDFLSPFPTSVFSLPETTLASLLLLEPLPSIMTCFPYGILNSLSDGLSLWARAGFALALAVVLGLAIFSFKENA